MIGFWRVILREGSVSWGVISINFMKVVQSHTDNECVTAVNSKH